MTIRKWLALVLRTDGALADLKAHLSEMIREEDSLSKASDAEKLHYQRGKVDALKGLLFLVTSQEK